MSVLKNYILGLDIGSNSVGWAVLETTPIGEGKIKPTGIGKTGTRVFEQGVEGDLDSGRDTSRNLKRREARTRRRMLERRARRLKVLFNILKNNKLLPPGDSPDSSEKVAYFHNLDAALKTEFIKRENITPDRTFSLVFPYLLRKTALDHELPPFEIGRAVYHLAQRRGFESNRKSPPKEDEDLGQVYEGIKKLEQSMAEASARTVGEYLAGLDPEMERIRSRWTARRMVKDEFEKIWNKQARFHPEILTTNLKEKIHRAMFYQRPLKTQRHLVGGCDLEPGRKRAPWACLEAQRFRLLQRVNDLEINSPWGEVIELSPEQRKNLIREMTFKGDRTFVQIKKLFGLKQKYTFNLQRGGEKKLPGDRVNSKLYAIFGARWLGLPDADKEAVLHDLRSIQKRKTLYNRALKHWGLDEEAASKLSDLSLEEGYCSHSREAIRKLLPLMEAGVRYAAAKKQMYPDRITGKELDLLPPLAEAMPELRNPVVARSLNQVRRVVNEIVRCYGKPALIRVEMAREMKKSRKQREDTWQKNRQNQKRREEAKKRIIAESEVQYPKKTDI